MKTEIVIKYFLNKSGVARALDCSPQAITKWGENVPVLRQYQIEVITNGFLQSDFTIKNIQKGKAQ